MLSILTYAIEHNLVKDLVYLDLTKVLDLVPHRKLIHKLEKYGISGQLLLWIKDSLSNRSQVCVTSAFFYCASVISGIPQMSVFCPILYYL